MSKQLVDNWQPVRVLDALIYRQLQRISKRMKLGPGNPMRAVHVGAFDGDWDRVLLEKFRYTHVDAIEPQPGPYKKLVKLQHVWQPHLTTYQLAIHPYLEEVTLYSNTHKTKRDQGASIFKQFSDQDHQIKGVTVPAISLSRFYQKHNLWRTDLLRINCEGSEYEIFTDTYSDLTFLKTTNVVALAIHGKKLVFLDDEFNRRKEIMTDIMREAGFRLLYGPDFTAISKVPVGHVWQLWCRKELL